ncbi:MAG: site-specific integrase, partial [Bacteroidota bacterium]
YLNTLEEERNYSSHTILAYRNDLRTLVAYLESRNFPGFQGLTRSDIRSYLGSQIEKGAGKKTLVRRIASLRSFFKHLQRHHLIDHNPTIGLAAPRPERRLPEVLSESAAEELLNIPDRTTVDGRRDAAILELFYSTGIRLSE